jgi:hypothetical protein
MTHEDAGKYAAKRAPGTVVDETLAVAVRDKTIREEIACAQAEEISAKLGLTLGEVGAAADLLETRITKCQLGLFGYPKEKFPEGRAVGAAEEVSPDIEAAIRGRLVGGRLPCKSAWDIAAERGLPRMAVSAACEKLKIRVKPCQLGSF